MHWKSLFTSQENENFKKAAVEGEQIPFKEVDVNAPTQMKWLGTHWDPTPIPQLHMWINDVWDNKESDVGPTFF